MHLRGRDECHRPASEGIIPDQRGTGVPPEREGFKKKQMTHSLLSFVIFPISPKRAWLMLKMTNAPSGAFVFFGGERGTHTAYTILLIIN